MPCSELSSLSNLLYALKHYKIRLQVSALDSKVCPKILEKFIDQPKKSQVLVVAAYVVIRNIFDLTEFVLYSTIV